MGIHQLGVRRGILSAIADYLERQQRAADKVTKLEGGKADQGKEGKSSWEAAGAEAGAAGAEASAPPIEEAVGGLSLRSDVTVRVSTECVVCLERTVSVLWGFLFFFFFFIVTCSF